MDIKNRTIVGGIKTEAGTRRTVPIHKDMVKYWEKWMDDKKDRGGYIFVKKDGIVMTQNYFRKFIYYPLLEKLGIERKSPHKCRDTFATMMKTSGADNLAIQQSIGHTDYAFTANKYTAKDIEFLKSNVDKIKF